MKKIQKQLTEMVYDVNPAEISSHIENDSLRQWCHAWGSKMLEIISSIPFVKDDNYEKGYQDGLNADKWVCLEDRLPEDMKEVLVSLKNGFVTMAWYRFGEFVPESNMINRFVEENPIIAWQPFPQEPKMKGE